MNEGHDTRCNLLGQPHIKIHNIYEETAVGPKSHCNCECEEYRKNSNRNFVPNKPRVLDTSHGDGDKGSLY